jgi:hypothetical protein
MLQRNLSDALVTALIESPFWRNICADPELQPEIRGGHVTVYYKGRGLIRELQLEGDRLVAKTHNKYIPISYTGNDDVLLAVDDAKSLQLDKPGQFNPEPPGLCNASMLRRYKRSASMAKKFPEGDLVQKIIRHQGFSNLVVDQEIAFQAPGESRDEVDLCYFDSTTKRLVFVEVKRRCDVRLLPSPNEPPEVLQQLKAYSQRLKDNRDCILKTYSHAVALKRELGLEERLKGVPKNLTDLREKPLLVIGDCTKEDVSQIMEAQGEWSSLLDGLEDVAGGLILCGTAGCRLSLEGRQRITF